jgi:myosin heavy subunit
VKPNKLKRSGVYDFPMVLAQLLYAGVLETVRIRRQGFPFREGFADFWRRATRVGFPVLVPGILGRHPALPPPV